MFDFNMYKLVSIVINYSLKNIIDNISSNFPVEISYRNKNIVYVRENKTKSHLYISSAEIFSYLYIIPGIGYNKFKWPINYVPNRVKIVKGQLKMI